MRAYTFDIEGDNLGRIRLKKGVLEPRFTKVHLLSMQDMATKEVFTYRQNDEEDTIQEGWDRLCEADVVIGHNVFDYDLPVMRELYGGEVKGRVVDTLVCARVLWPDPQNHPHGGNNLYRLSVASGSKNVKIGYEGGFDEWSQEMEDYCVGDVKATRDVYRWMLPMLRPYATALRLEHRVAEIIADQCCRGVCIDMDLARTFLRELDSIVAGIGDSLDTLFPPITATVELPKKCWWQDPTSGELYATKKEAPRDVVKRLVQGPKRTKEVTTFFNPGSREMVAQRLGDKYGWLPGITDKGNVSVTEQSLLATDYPEAHAVAKYNMARKRMTQLTDWLTRAEQAPLNDQLGVLYPSINPHATPTARMSHSQPNQTACPRVLSNDDGPILGYLGRWGYEMRSMWKPRPGMVMIGGDASGIDLRAMASYLSRWDDGLYIEHILSGDIHTINQKAGGLDTRPQGKETSYAFFYGSGNETLGDTIMHHSSLSPEQRKQYAGKKMSDIGAKYKRTFKLKTKGFSQFLNWCKAVARSKGFMRLPDGRRGPVRKEYAALNTLVQGTAGIVMKLALVLLHDALIESGLVKNVDFAFLLNAHDEMQLEGRPEHAEFIGRTLVWAIEEAGKRLKLKCPMTGEYKVGSSWADTH